MSALDGLLGKPGDSPMCRHVAKDASVHWWKSDAQPGDPCLCGELTKGPEVDIDVDAL